MSGWQKTAIILKGRDYAPMLQVGTNGYTNLSEYRKFCPRLPEGGEAPTDETLTASLQPSAQ